MLVASQNLIIMPGLDPLYYDYGVRLFFQHSLRWWHYWLMGFDQGQIISVVTLLHRDLRDLGPNFAYLKVLDTLALLLSVARHVIWVFVFRDPNKVPSLSSSQRGYYRRAVCVISAANVIPNFILHILITFLGFEARKTSIGLFLSLFSLLVDCSRRLWMVYRFLLRDNEEHYEPITPFPGTPLLSTSSRRQSMSAAAAVETYSGSSTSPLSYESHQPLDGQLSEAYAMQFVSGLPGELEEDFHGQGLATMETGAYA